MMQKNKVFTFLIKVTQKCNLRCTYCYERGVSRKFDMDENKIGIILHKIRSYLERNAGHKYYIALIWHGGEPLLFGPKKLESFFKMADTILRPVAAGIKQIIQTNGLLIDENFIGLFKKYDIDLGLSLDFYSDDRRDVRGRSVSSRVLKKIELIKKCGLDFGYITVITKRNVSKPKLIYKKMREIGSNVSLLPATNIRNSMNCNLQPSPKEYGRFLAKIATLWINDDKTNFCLQPIFNYLSILQRGQGMLCISSRDCSRDRLNIRGNGTVTNCDSFSGPDYTFGNIFTDTLDKILTDVRRKALKKRPAIIKKICKNCKWSIYCRGGCPGQTTSTKETFYNKTHYCEAIKTLLKTLMPFTKKYTFCFE